MPVDVTVERLEHAGGEQDGTRCGVLTVKHNGDDIDKRLTVSEMLALADTLRKVAGWCAVPAPSDLMKRIVPK